MKLFYCVVRAEERVVKDGEANTTNETAVYLISSDKREAEVIQDILEREKEILLSSGFNYTSIQLFTREMNPKNLMELLKGTPLRMAKRAFESSGVEGFKELDAEVIG